MKNRKLVEDAIKTDNKLLIAKLKLEEGWTDDEVDDIENDLIHESLLELDKKGLVVPFEQLIKELEAGEL